MKITPINAQNLQPPSSQRETSTSKTTGKPIDTRKQVHHIHPTYKSNDEASTRILPPPHNRLSKKDQQVSSHE